ncbi:conserved phage C-terminal domain-containing protein [Solibacillus sp. MA9]|uniref:Conserved phage C-terminal domain-containing protein n=1 Tax=Solibacillus palustris TaxID=2908203 RepID=A0ABS9UHI2_9BACL|nr:conserved phage C-terminal domain-containing protein [Solibacillus sp. MA9]MCH7323825.1 conserved phage C-terminal domain-containing protein [Solibacillus sp. MA9]
MKGKFLKLEKAGLVISTDKFNQFYVDRTKWYRIDYDKLNALFTAHSIQMNPTDVTAQTLLRSPKKRCEQFDLSHSNIKEPKKNNKNDIYSAQIDQIIDYLNKRASKNFTVYNDSNRRDIHERLKEGYTVEQCLAVIDGQVEVWKDDLLMERYLRPSTLFKKSKFEDYLQAKSKVQHHQPKPVILDFSAGEDW